MPVRGQDNEWLSAVHRQTGHLSPDGYKKLGLHSAINGSLWDGHRIHEVRWHYNDIIMGAIASQITSLTIVYSSVYSDADQRKHQSSVSLAFMRGIHRGLVNSPHKWPVTRKMFPFDDVIMIWYHMSIKPWLFTGHKIVGSKTLGWSLNSWSDLNNTVTLHEN